MNRNKLIILIWVTINLILVARYFWDSISIQCEPCLPEGPCPPCQTDFMEYFWWYLTFWNLIMFLVWLGNRIRTKKRVLTAD